MQVKLKLAKMHCKSCELLIKEEMADFGVEATADHKLNTVILKFNGKNISLENIKNKLKEIGYPEE